MSQLFQYLMAALLNPLLLTTVLMIVALYFFYRRRKLSFSLAFLSATTLFMSSTAAIIYPILETQSDSSALPLSKVKSLHRVDNRDLIMLVISAGRINRNPAYGEIDTVNGDTMTLLAFASWLHKRTELPIMLAGNTQQQHNATADAVLMNQAMLSHFNIAPRWIMADGENTMLAKNIYDRVNAAGYKRLLVVATDDHLVYLHKKLAAYGLGVIDAPAIFSKPPIKEGLASFIPSADVLAWTQQRILAKWLSND